MRKIIVTMWITLDGFIAGPNDEMEWIHDFHDEAMEKYEYDLVSTSDTLLLGRKTYQDFVSYWPNVPQDPAAPKALVDYANQVNAMHKVVFSRTLAEVDWHNSTIVKELVPEEIIKMKQEPGSDIVIYGSASIIRTLTNLGLVDEYQLLFHPVVLGSGKPLFKDIAEQVKLKLVSSKTHPSGVVVLSYQVLNAQTEQ